jgi:hypothetical protein
LKLDSAELIYERRKRSDAILITKISPLVSTLRRGGLSVECLRGSGVGAQIDLLLHPAASLGVSAYHASVEWLEETRKRINHGNPAHQRLPVLQ